jgi:hypothetical protein
MNGILPDLPAFIGKINRGSRTRKEKRLLKGDNMSITGKKQKRSSISLRKIPAFL